MERSAPRVLPVTFAEKAVRALLIEVPVWTLGCALAFGATGSLRAMGAALAGVAFGALVASTWLVVRAAPRDRLVRSERRRALWRADLAAARDAQRDDAHPEAAERKIDAAAVLAEDAARKRLAGTPDAELHAQLRTVAWPDPVAATAVAEGRWGDAVLRSIEVRVAGDATFEARWPETVAALDEAWWRATAPVGGG